ncbi:MAG: transposase zinc-binding domain-containing protein, partial [Silvanigrellaceae bacterium]
MQKSLDCSGGTNGALEKRTRYKESSVAFGSSCTSEIQTRSCDKGQWSSWSGTFEEGACAAGEPIGCGSLKHGSYESRVQYQSTSVGFGQSCQGELQVHFCNNGKLEAWSGTFGSATCAIQPPAACSNREFESYLRCGIYAHGFGRVQCGSCQHEKIVPYSCKGRGFCPSCGARRMAEAAIHLVDELLPLVPVRQFVITFPVQLRLWMARSKSLCAKVCEKVCAELTAHLQHASGIKNVLSGLVVFIQRFGSAANLNIHFNVIALDGVYEKKSTGRLKFYPAQAPSNETIQNLVSNISTK